MSESAAVTEPSTDAAEVSQPAGTAVRRWPVPAVGALTLIWLIVKLWASHGQIASAPDGTIGISTAAAALSGVFQATLLAGLGLGLLGAGLRPRAAVRWMGGIAGGVIAGGATGAVVVAAYPHVPSVDSIAVALTLCGVVGGIAAASGAPIGTLAAGAAGTLGALATITVLNSNAVLSRMLDWFGGDSGSPTSFVHASKLVQYTDFFLVGLVAGLVAHSFLRRRGERRFLLFPLAGGLAGVVLLVAFAFTEIGGRRLLHAANSLSTADQLVNHWESAESVPNAMIVLFVGAFVALVAFGRTLPSRSAGPTAKPAGGRSR